MNVLKSFLAAAGLSLIAAPGLAADIMVEDPYARAATPNAKSGAAFMIIRNMGEDDDRLIAVASDISARAELHTHIMDGDVMRMVHIEEGFALPAGQDLVMERGGKHVMFLGLKQSLTQGDLVEVTLNFEEAGDVIIEVPVDLERMPKSHAGGHGHGQSGHGGHDSDGHADHTN